jgi:RHS repeat-associated protein
MTISSSTVYFTWDANRSIPQVVDDETCQYVYGIGRIAQAGSSATHYYLSDGLGSTMALTDKDGDVVNTYDYDVFGAVRGMTGAQPNDFTFAGEQVDGSSDLYYLRARYYDAEVGRFISKDPKAVFPGWNQHPCGYAGANPLTYADPRGMDIFGDIVDCVSDPLDCGKEAVEEVLDKTDELRAPVTNLLAGSSSSIRAGMFERGRGIVIVEHCTGACKSLLDALGESAVAIGRHIFSKLSLAPALLEHELKHVEQYELLGDAFIPLYLGNQGLAAAYCATKSGDFSGCIDYNNVLERTAGPRR